MGLRNVLAVAMVTVGLAPSADADQLVRLTPDDAETVYQGVKQQLAHPDKAVFLPISFGTLSRDHQGEAWVCGRLRATSADGTYLNNESLYVGRLNENRAAFQVELLALSSAPDLKRVQNMCDALAKTASSD